MCFAKNAMSSLRSSSSAREDVLEEVLGELGVVGEIGERDLGLDHPELGEVAARVRVLGAERRAERVDLAQRQAVRLDVELARHGQARFACRRSPCRSRPCRRACAAGSRGRASRPGTSAPAPSASRRRDDRRVDPEEAVLVEEAVHRHRERVAHARDRAEDVRARPQVRDLAQVLQRVPLRLHRVGVGVVDPADDLDASRPGPRPLALALRRDELAGRRAPRSRW